MKDISLHVLDIVMNSITANSSLIEICINIQSKEDFLELIIKDNGKGMNEQQKLEALNPFYTTRVTRKVGLGLPLLKENVNKTNGAFSIASAVNEGTVVEAKFVLSHIDCLPLGDINETILSLILLEPEIDFVYTRIENENNYVLDTREIKRVLCDVPINHHKIIEWLKEDLLTLS